MVYEIPTVSILEQTTVDCREPRRRKRHHGQGGSEPDKPKELIPPTEDRAMTDLQPRDDREMSETKKVTKHVTKPISV